MTETNKTPEPIPVDSKKLIDALGTIFGGVIQLLAATEPGIAKSLSNMAINGTTTPPTPAPAGEPLKDFNPDDFEEIISADDLPWDTEPEEKPKEPPKKKASPKKQEQAALTADDLIRVVTQKIKQNRNNKDKILALLSSYGAAKVSDIPADKYECPLPDKIDTKKHTKVE